MSTEDTTANDVERMATIAVSRNDPPRRSNQRGRYVLTEVLGEGGMGTVYAAYDPHLQRNVAIKVVRGRDAKLQKRLQREAAVMAQVHHPNVVAVHDVEFDEEGVSLVMELVRGPNLSDWLRKNDPPWPEIVRAFVQAGRGLAVAHTAGIVHRDFKPGNVLVAPDGVFKVTDFGLAKPVAVEGSTGMQPASVPFTIAPTGKTQVPLAASVTVTGMVIGTFRYMAPEQHTGRPVDPRSDQYSFCVALWTALYGIPPFAGGEAELLRDKLKGPPQAPPRPQAPLPPGLVEAVRRGLKPDPQDRFPTMEPLLAELERSLRPRRMGPAAVATLGVLGAVGVGSWAALSLGASESDPVPADPAPAIAHGGEAELTVPKAEIEPSSEAPESIHKPPTVEPVALPAPPGPSDGTEDPAAKEPPSFDHWAFVIDEVTMHRTDDRFDVVVEASFADPAPAPVHLKVDACGAKIVYGADMENLDPGQEHTFRGRAGVGPLRARTRRCTLRFKIVDDEGKVVGYPDPRVWCEHRGEVTPGSCKGPLQRAFEPEDADEPAPAQPKPKGKPRPSEDDLVDPFSG